MLLVNFSRNSLLPARCENRRFPLELRRKRRSTKSGGLGKWALLVGLCVAVTGCRTSVALQGGSAFLELRDQPEGQRAGIWRPDANISIHVRGTCTGDYLHRQCMIELTDLNGADGGRTVLFREELGQTLPTFGVDTDRLVLVFVGEDGHGGWRQMLRCNPTNKTFQWSRRRYDDGM